MPKGHDRCISYFELPLEASALMVRLKMQIVTSHVQGSNQYLRFEMTLKRSTFFVNESNELGVF